MTHRIPKGPERLTPAQKIARAAKERQAKEAAREAALAREQRKAELTAQIRASSEAMAATIDPDLGVVVADAPMLAAHRALVAELYELTEGI